MATLSEIKLLRTLLVKSRFYFIPKGKQNLENIYELVKSFYPMLCDDRVVRTDNGEKEWHHQVRLALNDIKDKPAVSKPKDKKIGIWKFN